MKVKPNAVKQEYEKQDELKRSALRALSALAAIPKAGKNSLINGKDLWLVAIDRLMSNNLYFVLLPIDKNAQMADFLKYIQNTSDLQIVYQAVQKDSLNALSSNVANSSLISDISMDQS